MTTLAEIAAKFERRGAAFIASPADIAAKLARTRALVFDWDGVFNRGEKSSAVSSGFNEADSMGVNMLRFGLWLRDARLPSAAIVTGEANPTAELFATRERFHWLFQGVRDKRQAVAAICESEGLAADEVACIFDDINDLSMARVCGVRILVRRHASVLLHDRVAKLRDCDYITASGPGEYAVREAAELLLGLLDAFDGVVDSRVANDQRYRAYFSERQAVTLRKAGIADDGSITGAA